MYMGCVIESYETSRGGEIVVNPSLKLMTLTHVIAIRNIQLHARAAGIEASTSSVQR